MVTTRTRLRKQLIMGVALTATVVLVSCSQADNASGTLPPTSSDGPSQSSTTSPSSSSSASSSPSSTRAPAPAPSVRRIDVTVTGKQVQPQPGTVNIAVGESLTIAVTSDQNNTLHAHGFEIAKPVTAGQQMETTVKGARPGVYDFELHDPELRLFQVAVR